MRNILEDSVKEKLISESDNILRYSDDAEYIKKVLAVRAACNGVQTSEISKCFQVTERTVQIWIKKTIEMGFQSALTREKGSGRPKKLSNRQLECVKNWVDDDGPSYFEIDAQIWTGDLLSHVIQSEFHIKLSSKWCSNFIRERQNWLDCTDKQMTRRYSNAKKDRMNLKKERKKNEVLKKEIKELKRQLQLKEKELGCPLDSPVN